MTLDDYLFLYNKSAEQEERQSVFDSLGISEEVTTPTMQSTPGAEMAKQFMSCTPLRITLPEYIALSQLKELNRQDNKKNLLESLQPFQGKSPKAAFAESILKAKPQICITMEEFRYLNSKSREKTAFDPQKAPRRGMVADSRGEMPTAEAEKVRTLMRELSLQQIILEDGPTFQPRDIATGTLDVPTDMRKAAEEIVEKISKTIGPDRG